MKESRVFDYWMNEKNEFHTHTHTPIVIQMSKKEREWRTYFSMDRFYGNFFANKSYALSSSLSSDKIFFQMQNMNDDVKYVEKKYV